MLMIASIAPEAPKACPSMDLVAMTGILQAWSPKTALIACLLFGFTDALQIRLQGVEIPIIGTIPVQLIQGIPYVLTVVLLAGLVGKAIAPNAIGQPYIKER